MNPILVVFKENKQLSRTPIATTVFTIGRDAKSNLSLTGDEQSVSRNHAEIILERGTYWLEDHSRNGTALNGKKITERRRLNDGDEIGIGIFRLRFLSPTRGSEGASTGDPDGTGSSVIARPRKHSGPLHVTLRVMEGPLRGTEFKDWEGPLTLGKALDNQVVLIDDESVSRQHARVVQEGERYFIVDSDSANGTYVDGVKVQRARLKDGQKIKVGASTLVFKMTDSRVTQRRLNIAAISVISVCVIALLIVFLKPPDLAGQHIALARKYMADRDIPSAIKEYEIALTIQPGRKEAAQELNDAKDFLQAIGFLDQAETQAVAGHNEQAKELIDRVLNRYPHSRRAAQLNAEIKEIEDADLAMKSYNWESAVALLEKANTTFSNAAVITTRLQVARAEAKSAEAFAQATNDFVFRQFAPAKDLLDSIPTNSAYAPQAREYTDWIGQENEIARWFDKAQTDDRQGKIQEALRDTDQAISAAERTTSPDAPKTLSDLREKQRKLTAAVQLVDPLASAEQVAASQSADITALLQARDTCDKVTNVISDLASTLWNRAHDTRSKLVEELTALAQSNIAQADALLQTSAASARRNAVRLLELAAQADSSNQTAAEQARELRAKIKKDSLDIFDQAHAAEAFAPDKARELYEKVIQIGVPGEDYYEQAKAKLR